MENKVNDSDLSLLITSMLRLIRGDKSQEFLARRASVSSTQIYRWERGVSQIRWDSFFKLCQARKKSLDLFFSRKGSNVDAIFDFLDSLSIYDQGEELYEKKILSQSTVNRWKVRSHYPTVLQFLHLLQIKSPHFFYHFLEVVLGMENLKSLNIYRDSWGYENQTLARFPFLPAYISLVSKVSEEEIFHKKAFAQFSITKEQSKELLRELVSLEIIAKDDHGALSLPKPHTFHLPRYSKNFRLVNQYWISRNTSDKSMMDEESFYSFLIMNLSSTERDEIKNILKNSYEKCRKLDSDDMSRDEQEVSCLTIQFSKIQSEL